MEMTTNKNAYNAGIMGKTGKDFADEYFSEENQVVHESNAVVLVLKKSDEMDFLVEEMLLKDKAGNPSLVVEDKAGFWWLKADGKIEFDCDEASSLLGRAYNVYDLLVDVSSTIGRAYTFGNTFTITSELMGLDRKLQNI
jgi:methane monooxygenase regulatory protein B